MTLTVDFKQFASELRSTYTPEQTLWCYVLIDAVELAKRGSKSALSWLYDSAQFPAICSWLDLNPEPIRKAVIPTDFVSWLQQVRKPAMPRTDTPPAERLKRRVRRASQEKMVTVIATVPILAPVARAKAPGPALVPVTVSMCINAALALDIDRCEAVLSALCESSTLDEWECAIDRYSIESVIHLQQPMEQTTC